MAVSVKDANEKKRGEHKCKCIGRLGSDGKKVYNGYYHARKQAARKIINQVCIKKQFHSPTEREEREGRTLVLIDHF